MTSDVGLFIQTDGTIDLQVAAADLQSDAGLRTACLISLFTDRRAAPEDLPAGENSLRGWWADLFAQFDGDLIGSRLWLLKREKQTVETLRRAEDYSREALQWMIDDGVASTVDATASYDSNGDLIIEVLITQVGGNKTFRFSAPWATEGARGST